MIFTQESVYHKHLLKIKYTVDPQYLCVSQFIISHTCHLLHHTVTSIYVTDSSIHCHITYLTCHVCQFSKFSSIVLPGKLLVNHFQTRPLPILFYCTSVLLFHWNEGVSYSLRSKLTCTMYVQMKKVIVKHGHIDVYLSRDELSSLAYDFPGMDDHHNHYNVPAYGSVSVSLLRSYYQQMKGPMLLPFCLSFLFHPYHGSNFFGLGPTATLNLPKSSKTCCQLMEYILADINFFTSPINTLCLWNSYS